MENQQEISSDRSANDPSSVRSVRRALDILALLNEERTSLNIRDTSAETGLPKTTVLRLLQTLEQAGLLWGLGGGQYVPGPALLRWARIADETWMFPPEFKDVLFELSQTARETANVYVRKGLKRICIAQAAGPQSLRHVIKVGDELPLWAGAAAKILLMDVPKTFLEKVAIDSPKGIEHLTIIQQSVGEAAKNGWAVSHAERDDGVSAVAVPLFGSDGRCIAALSLSGPSSRFSDERVATFIEELKKSAQEISAFTNGGLRTRHVALSNLSNNQGDK